MNESARLRIIIASHKRENERLQEKDEERRAILKRLAMLERSVADLYEAIGMEPTQKLVALEAKRGDRPSNDPRSGARIPRP